MSGLERLYSPPEIGAPGKRKAGARRRDLALAGLFVLAMGALVLTTLTVLMPGLLGDSYRLQVYFADAPGLYISTQVLQDGYVIGIVESTTPVFPGRDEEAARCPPNARDSAGRSTKLPCFRATLRIREGWPIPSDSTAVLGSAGLLQGKAIKIQPGASDALLHDGQTLESTARETDLLAQLEELTGSLRELVDKTIEPALASIRDQIQTIQDLLGTGGKDAQNKDRLAGVLQNMQQLSADMASAVDPKRIQSILFSIQQVSDNLADASATFVERSDEIKRAVKGYGDLAADIRDMVRQTKPSVRGSLDDAQFLLQELSAALVPILSNIEETTRNLSALSRDLRSNPAVIIEGHKVEDRTPWLE